MPSTPSNDWHSIIEYARYHQISDMTVRRHIKAGKLHAILRDGKYFIPPQDAFVQTPSKNQPTPTREAKPQPVKQTPAKIQQDTDKPTKHQGLKARNLPEDLVDLFSTSTSATLPVESLINLCDELIGAQKTSEKRLGDAYENKILHLKAEVHAKDLELKQLYQQVEDLQVLIKVLENSSK